MPSPSTYVPPSGDPLTARFIFVGEQPGRREVSAYPRRPFVGPAGKELDKCTAAVGIARDEGYYTNVIKDLDKPLYHYAKWTKSGYLLNAEALEYYRTLAKELQDIKAKVIIAVGNVALNALTDNSGIEKWRGSILYSPRFPGKAIVPCLHTATIIPYHGRDPKMIEKYKYTNKLLIQFDIKRAKDIADGKYVPTKRIIRINPSHSETMFLLEESLRRGKNGATIDLDIELFNEEVSRISISYGEGTTSISFIDSRGDYFTVEQEANIWLEIAEVLENRNIRKRGQNLSFDTHFLLRRYGIKTHNIDDTMVAQKIIMPDYPIGLHFLTSIYTDQPYYKDDGKTWGHDGDWDKLSNYNGLDSEILEEIFSKQWKEMKKQNNEATYARAVATIEPLVYMQEHGIRIDVEGMKKESEDLLPKIEQMRKDLNILAGEELNANSPKQVANYFYITKAQKPYKKEGKVTTDEKAMVRLARKGFREADKILEIRRTIKKRSTYLNPDKIDSDGRMRCSYNPVGTRFSRVSSSKNIFGTGGNLQNQPHDVLEFFMVDRGFLGYTLDLSQAENRIVAYVGNVTQMIEAFESGKDVHALTASLISEIPIDEIIRQDKENIFCSLGSGNKTWRFYGKKSDHELNYDIGVSKFSLILEIPEREGKFLMEKYFLAYPEVRNKYHKGVVRQLRNNRTITNLMGRRTHFLEEWGDKLFKAGYSCNPQGTVGDVINERGLNYIYYNPEEFGPVELLMQVHDSINFQIPLSTPWEEHAEMIMKIKRNLETPLETEDGVKFVIPVDVKVGLNFGLGMKKVSGNLIGMFETPEVLRETYNVCLEEAYDGFC